MAVTTSLSQAKLNLGNLVNAVLGVTFDDLHGAPSTTINYFNGWGLANYDLATAAATPSASNPIEVATTQVWGDKITASGTSHTLDLTALPRTFVSAADDPLDLTGLKLQGFVILSDFANTADISIGPGATNGYNLQNDAACKVVVAPAGVEMCLFPELTAGSAMPDVAVADAELDLASTMSNFIFSIILFAG